MDADATVTLTHATVQKLLCGYRPNLPEDSRLVTWIPTERNPSKLIEHRWDGKQWIAQSHARFVPIDV